MAAGPNRVTVNDVVLANFSLTDPFKDRQVLWPKGLLVPGLQPGTTLPRRLYLQDVQLLVDAGTLQQYLRFFRQNDTLIYTVSTLRCFWATVGPLLNCMAASTGPEQRSAERDL